MITIIKHGNNKTARIICARCACEFTATADEMTEQVIYQGFCGMTVTCPECGTRCYDGQGGADLWDWLTEE